MSGVVRDAAARPASDPTSERPFHTLSAVTDRIAHYLQPALGKPFWVRAEISSGRERGGNFYCDLVETSARGKVVAKLSCTIWSRHLVDIRRRFREQGLELSIENGTVVGVQCSLQFSAQYGLSLQVEDADPSVSLGELERKKREILVRLRDEGLGEPNKQRVVPLLPQRIGLITSHGSAAYSDFVTTLLEANDFGFTIFLADANMQGSYTEGSVLRALHFFDERDVDLVVLVRGGGSKIDLYSLDNEVLARAIARHRHPVWTGIGHEIDSSVLDYVANRAFVTPTAVAEELVARYDGVQRRLDAARNRLPQAWAQRIERERDYVRRMTTGLRQGSRKLLRSTRTEGSLQAVRLRERVGRRLAAEHRALDIARHAIGTTPAAAVRRAREQLAERGRRLATAGGHRLTTARMRFAQLAARFDAGRLSQPIGRARKDLRRSARELERKLAWRLGAERRELAGRQRTLAALDPRTSLRRGFSLVYDDEGALIKSVDDVREGDALSIRTSDGRIAAETRRTERIEDEQG